MILTHLTVSQIENVTKNGNLFVVLQTSLAVSQVAETSTPGRFTLWVMVGPHLHQLKLTVPRVFYVNSHTTKELRGEGTAWRKVNKSLPRSAPVLNLSEYCVSESIFQDHAG